MLSKNARSLLKRDDLTHVERRLWGCLARVESMGEDSGLIGLVIPSWNVDEVLEFPWDKFPVKLMSKFEEGYRFHTEANVGAPKKVSDLYINIDNYRFY